MSDETGWGPNGLTVAAIRARQARPETARYDIGVLLVGIAAAETRVQQLTELVQEAYKHLPYGGTRDWISEVMGWQPADADEED